MENNIICKCGRLFTSKTSLYGHQGHCEVHLRRKPRLPFGGPDKTNWRKNASKDKIKMAVDKRIGSLKLKYGGNLNNVISKGLREWNLNHSKDEFKKRCDKQSNTRKMLYRSGDLKPAPGVGIGKKCYITYRGKTVFLRSTYEFIYSLFLAINGKDINYETEKAELDGHTYISDFLDDGEVVEVKGIRNSKVEKIRKAFESNGYKIRFVFVDEVERLKEVVKSHVADFDNVLLKIYEGNKKKDFYRCTLLEESPWVLEDTPGWWNRHTRSS